MKIYNSIFIVVSVFCFTLVSTRSDEGVAWRQKLRQVEIFLQDERQSDESRLERFSESLLDLGNALKDTADSVALKGLSETDVILLNLAKKYADAPSRLDELLGWYGNTKNRVPEAIARKTIEAMRAAGVAEESLPPLRYIAPKREIRGGAGWYLVFPFHLSDLYRPDWEIIFLGRRVYWMENCSAAIYHYADAEMVPLLILAFRNVAAYQPGPYFVGRKRGPILNIANCLIKIGDRRALLGLAEIWEYSDPDKLKEDEEFSVRRELEYSIGGPRLGKSTDLERAPLDWGRYAEPIRGLLKEEKLTSAQRGFLERALQGIERNVQK